MFPKQAKVSQVWRYFELCTDDTSNVSCMMCKAVISRGKAQSGSSSYSTTPMRRHLQVTHGITLNSKSDEPDSPLTVAMEDPACTREKIGEKRKTQPTISEVLQKKQVYDSSHPVAKSITARISEMIAVDFLPLSFVENPGFRRLMNLIQPRYKVPSRKTFGQTILPEVYMQVKNKIKDQLTKAAGPVYGTTDIWTSRQGIAYMSVTSHYVSWTRSELQPTFSILGCTQFEETHTADNILQEIKNQAETWGINFAGMTTDNAANMVKAFGESNIMHLRCAAHTINLIVKCALANAPDSVRGVVSRARNIVSAYHKSPRSAALLRKYLREHGLFAHELVQDMPVRWNSTFLMLERLVQLKEPVTYLNVNKGIGEPLDYGQWLTVQSLVVALRSFHTATCELSGEKVTLSVVIPMINSLFQAIRGLRNAGQDGAEQLFGVEDFIDSLEQQMARRFAVPTPGIQPHRDAFFYDEEIYNKYVVAALLDPRVKLSCFPASERVKMTHVLEDSAVSHFESRQLEVGSPSPEGCSSSEETAEDKEVSLFAFQSLEKPEESSRSRQSNSVEDCRAEIRRQVRTYLNHPRLKMNGSPLQFWASYRAKSAVLFEMATDSFSAQATSVSSERLFSSAGIVVSPLRNRLNPANVEMLTTLHVNLPRLDFNY